MNNTSATDNAAPVKGLALSDIQVDAGHALYTRVWIIGPRGEIVIGVNRITREITSVRLHDDYRGLRGAARAAVERKAKQLAAPMIAAMPVITLSESMSLHQGPA